MSYCFFTFTPTIIIVPFLSQITFSTIKFTSKVTRDMFWKCPWLIYPFDHNKYFQVHSFYFIRNTFSTKWIFNTITVLITPVHNNDDWIVMKLIKIQINKHGLTMHCWLFTEKHFMANDPPKHNSTSTRTIKAYLMKPGIYRILCFSSNTYEWLQYC